MIKVKMQMQEVNDSSNTDTVNITIITVSKIFQSKIMNDPSSNISLLIALPWYMWKNTGNYDYPWELKRVPRESPDEQRFDVIPQDTSK